MSDQDDQGAKGATGGGPARDFLDAIERAKERAKEELGRKVDDLARKLRAARRRRAITIAVVVGLTAYLVFRR